MIKPINAKGSEIPKAHHEAKADLVDFLRSIDFLSEYRLRFIETTKTDFLKKITNYEYRDIQGDHPLAGIQSGSTKQTDVEAGKSPFSRQARKTTSRLPRSY